MTYSIIVTILLIIFIALFIVSIRAGVRNVDYMQRSYASRGDEISVLSIKVNSLVDVKEALRRQIAHLEGKNAEMLERMAGKNEFIKTQRDRMKHLMTKNKDLKNDLLMVSDLIHVKFTARLPSGNLEKTLFKLGLGPCGLHVKSLKWTEQEDRYLIDQLCTNGERKQFTYYKSDVVGRIEFRHGQV